MRVACIYPTFDPQINELARAWLALAGRGRVSIRAIGGTTDKLKGREAALTTLTERGIVVRRKCGVLLDERRERVPQELLDWLAEHDPQVIVCGTPTAAVGRALKALCKAPLLLHTETWFDSRFIGRRWSLGQEWLKPLGNRLYTAWLGRGADHLVTMNPEEKPQVARAGERVSFVPFPHMPAAAHAALRPPWSVRDRHLVVCIGSVSAWKGAQTLGDYLSALLEGDPAMRVHLVGPLLDDVARRALEKCLRWPERVVHTVSLERDRALALMAGSLCVFNPSRVRGWGSVGDAWTSGTPIIATNEFYDLAHARNCLVAPDPRAFVAAVQALRADRRLWDGIAEQGYRAVTGEHSLDHVADALGQVVERVHGRHHGQRASVVTASI